MKHSLLAILLISCGGSDFSASTARVINYNNDSGASSYHDSGAPLPFDANANTKPFDANRGKVDDTRDSGNDSGKHNTSERDSGSHVPDSGNPVEASQPELICPSSSLPSTYCTTKYNRVHFPCNYTPANCIGSSLPHALDVRCCE